MNYAAARHNMVENQIRTNRVTDPQLIAALDALPRELFVPVAQQGLAYIDRTIPIGQGRSLMTPMTLARLLQLAAVQPEDVVLVVGAGTGYSAALLARLASTVVALESDASLSAHAAKALSELEVDTVAWIEGALKAGHAAAAPYNVILIDGAVEEIPAGLIAQLAEGGRLVTVVQTGTVGRATLVTRSGQAVSSRVEFDTTAPALPGFERSKGFVF